MNLDSDNRAIRKFFHGMFGVFLSLIPSLLKLIIRIKRVLMVELYKLLYALGTRLDNYLIAIKFLFKFTFMALCGAIFCSLAIYYFFIFPELACGCIFLTITLLPNVDFADRVMWFALSVFYFLPLPPYFSVSLVIANVLSQLLLFVFIGSIETLSKTISGCANFMAELHYVLLYPVLFLISTSFNILFKIYNCFFQVIFCPALLYSFSNKKIIDDRSISDALTFSWGGMFHSASMNAAHFSNPKNGLHIAYSHRLTQNKDNLIKYYVKDILSLMKAYPEKKELNFLGYSLGGAIMVEVLNALLKDNMDLSEYKISLTLDRTFKTTCDVVLDDSYYLHKYPWHFVYNIQTDKIIKEILKKGTNIDIYGITANNDWALSEGKLSSKHILDSNGCHLSKKWTNVESHVGNDSNPHTDLPGMNYY
ncbi:MAG: hypothetical protein VX835_01185 [Pseudomonadota bacterium]|nr:hypothetical protein [Pseudomonadota bacterium]